MITRKNLLKCDVALKIAQQQPYVKLEILIKNLEGRNRAT